MMVASSPRSARVSSMTTTTRCSSTSTVETLTRPPGPAATASAARDPGRLVAGVVTVTVTLLRVTRRRRPGTGCQSSRFGRRSRVRRRRLGVGRGAVGEGGRAAPAWVRPGRWSPRGSRRCRRVRHRPAATVRASAAAAACARRIRRPCCAGVGEVGAVALVGVAPLHPLDERLGRVEELLVPRLEVADLGGLVLVLEVAAADLVVTGGVVVEVRVELLEQDRVVDQRRLVVDDVPHVEQQPLLEGEVTDVEDDVLARRGSGGPSRCCRW